MLRFSFDHGSGSLGWAVFELDANGRICRLIDLGVRIFPTGRDPQNHASNALGRRGPRQQRRQLDRRIARRTYLTSLLVKAGLMPESDRDDFFRIDPYIARARAASGEATQLELGRAIWHISQHRGFKSNRKTDAAKDDGKNDVGAVASANATLDQLIRASGAPTYGAWLAGRHLQKLPVRVRGHDVKNRMEYDFYPRRDMLEQEFDLMWERLADTLPDSVLEHRDAIRSVVFFQRPLKPVLPGRCSFFPEQYRLPKWHPMAQEFLILQQLNSIRLIGNGEERPLTLEERDRLAAQLMAGEQLTWRKVISILGVPEDTDINLELGGLKELAANQLAARFKGKDKKPGPLYSLWDAMPEDQLLKALDILDTEASTDRVIARLTQEADLPGQAAELMEKIPLPAGHLALGERAVTGILGIMRREVVVYSEAVQRAGEEGAFGEGIGAHHSDLRGDGPGYPELPPYNRVHELQRMIGTGTNNPDDPDDKRYGRISNPTVHIVLNQYRIVMNALIKAYGKPEQVVLETTRELAKSARELNEAKRNRNDNEKRNAAWRAEIEAAGVALAEDASRDAMLRMRLWEELGTSPSQRLCPYTGELISLKNLFSDEIEIDHILPREETFDNGPGNLTLCYRKANRAKAKRAPGDAWHGDELESILARVKAAPGSRHKLWRFRPGALEKWQNDRGFEARQLHATAHASKVMRAYTESLFPKDGKQHVWTLSGQLTALLRSRWGLRLPDQKAKTRIDHRHHAIDAATIAAIDPRLIQMVQTLARRTGSEHVSRFLPDIPQPYEGFSKEVNERVASVVVSHRPRSRTPGRLQEDGAYSYVQEVPENEEARLLGNLVIRKSVAGLTEKQIVSVRDPSIRSSLIAATQNVWGDEKALKRALSEWSAHTGHKRLRVLVRDASARPVKQRPGKPFEGETYKWLIPGEVHFIDILEDPAGKWFRFGTDGWAAASGQAITWKEAHPDCRFIMRLYKGDTIQLFDWDRQTKECIPGTNRVMLVTSIPNSATNNNVKLACALVAGTPSEQKDGSKDPQKFQAAAFETLRQRRARRVVVDELGRIRTVPYGKVP